MSENGFKCGKSDAYKINPDVLRYVIIARFDYF